MDEFIPHLTNPPSLPRDRWGRINQIMVLTSESIVLRELPVNSPLAMSNGQDRRCRQLCFERRRPHIIDGVLAPLGNGRYCRSVIDNSDDNDLSTL
jgi:hypothetical protein